MARSLPRLLAVAAMLSAIAGPLHAQYLFLDANGDGKCDCGDVIDPGGDSVDVWVDTEHIWDGSPATCATGEALSIDGYRVIVRAFAVTISGFVNKRPEFSVQTESAISGTDGVFGYSAPSGPAAFLPGGKYLLGTVAVQGPPGGAVNITSATSVDPSANTEFHSECAGGDADHWIKLGVDFMEACAVGGTCDDAHSTTWGHIKEIYR
jgi:hypothetical protein